MMWNFSVRTGFALYRNLNILYFILLILASYHNRPLTLKKIKRLKIPPLTFSFIVKSQKLKLPNCLMFIVFFVYSLFINSWRLFFVIFLLCFWLLDNIFCFHDQINNSWSKICSQDKSTHYTVQCIVHYIVHRVHCTEEFIPNCKVNTRQTRWSNYICIKICLY